MKLLIHSLIFQIFFAEILFSQPKLHLVGGSNFDLGKVYTSMPVKKILVIENKGTEPLIISDVSTSCGCTGMMVSNNNIAPGDSGILEITFEAWRFTGKVEQAVSFKSNDPTQRDVRIVFSAEVEKVIEIRPDYLFFGNIKTDSTSVRDLSIKNASKETIKILSTISESELIKIDLPKQKLNPGETIIAKCKLSPEKSGIIKGNIIVTTDHPKVPSISLRFYGFARDKDRKSTLKPN